jgi:uncharacterized membrane protein YedE/YeeE
MSESRANASSSTITAGEAAGYGPAHAPGPARSHAPGLWAYLLVGVLFGITITKAEVISWFRIQEMFRFQGFHMYGVFMTALPTAIISVQLLKRRGARTLGGERIAIPPKRMGSGARYVVGGVFFGLGWALTGACPGPLFALLGAGVPGMAVVIASALAGTWAYGLLRPRLPH